MYSTLTLLALAAASAVAQPSPVCQYSADGYTLAWRVVGEQLVFNLRHRTEINRWTGVGFGDNMADMDFIMVEVTDRPRIVDKSIKGYSSVAITSDALNSVETFSCEFNNGTVRAAFRRPLRGGGANKDLSQCLTWKFPTSGGELRSGTIFKHDRTPVSQRICAYTCEGASRITTVSTATIPTTTKQLPVTDTMPTLPPIYNPYTPAPPLPSLPPETIRPGTLPPRLPPSIITPPRPNVPIVPAVVTTPPTPPRPTSPPQPEVICTTNDLGACVRNMPKVLAKIMKQMADILRDAIQRRQ